MIVAWECEGRTFETEIPDDELRGLDDYEYHNLIIDIVHMDYESYFPFNILEYPTRDEFEASFNGDGVDKAFAKMYTNDVD